MTLPALAGVFFLWKGDLLLSQIALLADYQISGFRRWGESHFSTFTFQVHPFIAVLGGLGAWRAMREREPAYLTAVFLPLLAVLAGVRRVRYLMIFLPLIAVAASYGVCSFRDPRLRRFAVWNIVLFSLVTAVFLYRPFLMGLSFRNLQGAAQLLNETGQGRIDVFVSPKAASKINPVVAVPLLDLYTRGELRFRYEGMEIPAGTGAESSPFRFSWRYRNPDYYREGGGAEGETAAVFIAGSPGEALPTHLEERTIGYERESYETDDGLSSTTEHM